MHPRHRRRTGGARRAGSFKSRLSHRTHELPGAAPLGRLSRRPKNSGVPMLREEVAVGVILSAAANARPSPTSRSSCLKTFADQAVIAIENVRLFNELQEKNQRLTEAHGR